MKTIYPAPVDLTRIAGVAPQGTRSPARSLFFFLGWVEFAPALIGCVSCSSPVQGGSLSRGLPSGVASPKLKNQICHTHKIKKSSPDVKLGCVLAVGICAGHICTSCICNSHVRCVALVSFAYSLATAQFGFQLPFCFQMRGH